MHIVSTREVLVEYCWTKTITLGFPIKTMNRNRIILACRAQTVTRLCDVLTHDFTSPACEEPAKGTREIWQLCLWPPAFKSASWALETLLSQEGRFRRVWRRLRAAKSTPSSPRTSVASSSLAQGTPGHQGAQPPSPRQPAGTRLSWRPAGTSKSLPEGLPSPASTQDASPRL